MPAGRPAARRLKAGRCAHHLRQRPYQAEYTVTRSINEVKQLRVRLVLGWVTAWEPRMQVGPFLFYLFPRILSGFVDLNHGIDSARGRRRRFLRQRDLKCPRRADRLGSRREEDPISAWRYIDSTRIKQEEYRAASVGIRQGISRKRREICIDGERDRWYRFYPAETKE